MKRYLKYSIKPETRSKLVESLGEERVSLFENDEINMCIENAEYGHSQGFKKGVLVGALLIGTTVLVSEGVKVLLKHHNKKTKEDKAKM